MLKNRQQNASKSKSKLAKFLVFLLIFTVFASVMFTLSSCNNGGSNDNTGNSGGSNDVSNAKTYTVSFNTKCGITVPEQKVEHGSKITVPDEITREGYIFDGWYYQGEKWSFAGYVVTEDMVLEASWIPAVYTVTITSNLYEVDQYIHDTITCGHGTKLTEIELPFWIPSEYNFVGFYTESGKKWDFAHDKVVSNMTLEARYEYLYYTVSFDTLGFGSVSSKMVPYGSYIGSVNYYYENDSLEFKYWSINGKDKIDTNNYRVYEDITLIAVFRSKNSSSTDTPSVDLDYADGTVLRMATGYINATTGLFFDASIAGEGIVLADGKTYFPGDLKPTWVEVQNVLKVQFENKYQGQSASKEFIYWQERLDEVDMVTCTLAQIVEAGDAGKLVNIFDYLDEMPNFKKFLMDNPTVLLSIASIDSSGNIVGIYGAPYFDGMSDIERVPLMRVDWVEQLLNGEGEFTAFDSKTVITGIYTPYMPTSGKLYIDVVNAHGTGTETIVKNYDKAGNIIAKMNAAGNISGVEAVNMLRKYIDEAYDGYYGTNRADLFIGQNAAWDADELVALLRCVVANPQTLNGTDAIEGLFSREDDNNQRRVDMFRFAGTLFGVRGLESRQDYLYVGTDGKLHDARQEADTYEALNRMNAMVQEGLIASSFVNKEDTDTGVMLKNDAGFMHYDYNQTQTVYNETKLDEGEKYRAVLIPVAHWFDGTDPNGVYMRFTESWRSVKTDCWAISKAGVAYDTDKLHAALALIDFAYSERGQILLSYGPDEFIKIKPDGSYVTFNFNGKEMPVIADATYEELWLKANGNYTNYARQYLGSTLAFVKSQAFEYQCTHVVGKEGMAIISNAIKYDLIKHPELTITDNPWYSIVPITLPNTKAENNVISGFTELGSLGKFSYSKYQENLFVDIIVNGYEGAGFSSSEEVINTVKNSWNGWYYLQLKQDAFDRCVTLYNDYIN